MNITVKRNKDWTIEDEIQKVTQYLKNAHPTDIDYQENLKALKDLKDLAKKKDHIKPDTLFNGLIQLTSIGLVLKYEELNVISTKAWNWILRGGR